VPILLLSLGILASPIPNPLPASEPRPLVRLSKDTLHEQRYSSVRSDDAIYLVNPDLQAVRIQSLEIQVDRSIYSTLSMDFNVRTLTATGSAFEKVFYWSDEKGAEWFSQPLTIPPRDSIRISLLRLDRCPKCVGQKNDPASLEINAPVLFRTSQGQSLKLLVKGWYLSKAR
jgi:hypothetical protein